MDVPNVKFDDLECRTGICFKARNLYENLVHFSGFKMVGDNDSDDEKPQSLLSEISSDDMNGIIK